MSQIIYLTMIINNKLYSLLFFVSLKNDENK